MAATITVPITDLGCYCCVNDLEQRLRTHPHLATASVDYRAGTATLTARHEALTDADARAIVHATGYRCDREPASLGHLAHRVATAPITMGTTQDRMQYELEALTRGQHGQHGHAAHGGAATTEQPRPAAGDHSGHQAMTIPVAHPHQATPATDPHVSHAMSSASTVAGHDAPAPMGDAPPGHGAHGMHDMSDPTMAASMERDMRNRFVARILSDPRSRREADDRRFPNVGTASALPPR